jgi:hypothetical protein
MVARYRQRNLSAVLTTSLSAEFVRRHQCCWYPSKVVLANRHHDKDLPHVYPHRCHAGKESASHFCAEGQLFYSEIERSSSSRVIKADLYFKLRKRLATEVAAIFVSNPKIHAFPYRSSRIVLRSGCQGGPTGCCDQEFARQNRRLRPGPSW